MAHARKSRKHRSRRSKSVRIDAPADKKSTKSYIRKNAYKIDDLKKDVAYLKRARHGALQQNSQNSTVTMVPTADYPIITDLTDFTCYRDALVQPPVPARTGCRFYQWSVAGLVSAGNYSVQDYVGNPYWANQNYDQVDTGKYLPVSAHYTVRVEGRPSLDNTRVRIQVFQARASTIIPPSNQNDLLTLPNSLVHLANMADPTINKLNPIFFKEYKKLGKWMFINSTKTDGDTKGTTGNIFYHKFSIHPKKPKYQAVTLPNTPNDPAIEPGDGQFGPLQCSPDSPLWMLISTDDGSALSGDQVTVRVSRRVVWRDAIGSMKVTP